MNSVDIVNLVANLEKSFKRKWLSSFWILESLVTAISIVPGKKFDCEPMGRYYKIL